jgi:CheY-like chemotaxis protein
MRTVLIIEDHTESRDCLRQLVEKPERLVVTANNGQEALERVKSIPPPCLILLDLAMPRMNGREFLRIKNADSTIARIPTIVVSGTPTDLPAGAVDHLTKPVDVNRLQALVNQYC